MEHLSRKVEQRLQWRRDKVREYSIKGLTQRDIASILQVPLTDVNRDLKYMRQQAKKNIQHFVDEYLPAEYENCLDGLNNILMESWNTAASAELQNDIRSKLQALALAKECYTRKLELLSSGTMVQRAVDFINRYRDTVTRPQSDNGKDGFDWLDCDGEWHFNVRAYIENDGEWHQENGDLIWPQPKYESGTLIQPQLKEQQEPSEAQQQSEELEELEELPQEAEESKS